MPIPAPLAAAALTAAFLLGGCASPGTVAEPPPGATAIPAPQVRPGDHWEYSVRDAYTGVTRGILRHTVSGVYPDRVVVDVTRDGERVDTHIYAPGWNGLEHPLRNLPRFRFEPPFPAYAFPLFPGRTWRGVVDSIDPATGKRHRTHVHAEVGGWRRLRVAAGEFDALPVRRYVFAGNAGYFTSQEEIVETDWYAPSVGRVILSEGSSHHIDTSRSGGGRGRPLRVRGDWLIAELVAYSVR